MKNPSNNFVIPFLTVNYPNEFHSLISDVLTIIKNSQNSIDSYMNGQLTNLVFLNTHNPMKNIRIKHIPNYWRNAKE